jgi:menaquinone-dependent protoporphyrinogen oxidase
MESDITPGPTGTGPLPDAARSASRAAIATGGRVLLVYATRHGSTREVAEAVAEELRATAASVDLREVTEAPGPAGYDAVVVGGPMIMGWHRQATKYVKAYRRELAQIPTAFFVTAASLTDTGEDEVDGTPIVIDTWLVKAPRSAGKLTRKERYALPSHYLGDILKECAPLRPRTVAFFAGSLDLTTMNIFEKLFVLLVVGATPGDGRHWEQIRAWGAELGETLSR